MKKITHLDMSAFMAAYTARVNAEHARAEAIREGRLPKPQPSERLRVTDLH
jgi:hypothetical protein